MGALWANGSLKGFYGLQNDCDEGLKLSGRIAHTGIAASGPLSACPLLD